jgi:hypothetical protein
MIKSALLLIGSPKPAGSSSSEALAKYLAQRLTEQDIATTTMRVAHALRSDERMQEMLHALDRADLFVLAFPLYVDSLPYLVIQALERIAAHRLAQAAPAPLSFLAMANSGFPEASQNETALAICRQFAAEAGLNWAGGLAIGGGGAIGGRPLESLGGMMRNVVSALDLTAAALARGESVPCEAVALAARPIMPAWAYTIMGNLGWLIMARQNRVLTRLGAQPFAQRP